MELVAAVLDLVYVPACAACDARVRSGTPLCPPCAESLVPLGTSCPRCAEPQEGPRSLLCARCRRRGLPLEAIVAPYRYGGELAAAIARLKFDRRPDVARTLAPLLAPALATLAETDAFDLAVPVPLHWRRQARRTYNQSALLLDHARRHAGRPARAALRTDRLTLRRRRATAPQTGLGATERAANVRGAFAVARGRRERLAGARVLLFDDVVTTGATLAAAARALRAAGAKTVVGLALARAEA